MTREEEIGSFFEETVGVFERLLFPLRLSDEERSGFEERVFLWFDRFTRRPGNERVPVARFLIPVLSGARSMARELAASKGLELPILFEEPVQIGVRLGLVEEVEEPPRL